MTFVAASFLNISINLLLLVFVVVCFLMTLVILMQRPKQEGLGAAFGGGVTDQVFGARTTNVLQRGTVYLGSMFFIISLLLSVLIGQKNKVAKTVTDKDKAAKVEVVKPVEENKDAAPKSLSEELPADNTAPVVIPPAEVPPGSPDASVPPAETTPAETAPTEPTAPADATPVPPAAPSGETTTPPADSSAPAGEIKQEP